MRVFIGYDPREDDAYRVCRESLIAHSSIELNVKPLKSDILRRWKLYTRAFHRQSGQMVDNIDGLPFSTDFAFTRFMVPYLSNYRGWAIFCDCDFLFTGDIANLLPLLDESKAVMVVKHNHQPADGIKMDGQAQSAYPRKNWSSFIAWNCAHPSNRNASPHNVNTRTGQWLHGFSWLRDYEIGELPQTWNWLSGVSKPRDDPPVAIHFTLGVPSLPGYENSPYADLWRDEFNRLAQKETAA